MTADKNEEFERSNICWICGKLIGLDDNKLEIIAIQKKKVIIEAVHIGVVISTLKLVKKIL